MYFRYALQTCKYDQTCSLFKSLDLTPSEAVDSLEGFKGRFERCFEMRGGRSDMRRKRFDELETSNSNLRRLKSSSSLRSLRSLDSGYHEGHWKGLVETKLLPLLQVDGKKAGRPGKLQ